MYEIDVITQHKEHLFTYLPITVKIYGNLFNTDASKKEHYRSKSDFQINRDVELN